MIDVRWVAASDLEAIPVVLALPTAPPESPDSDVDVAETDSEPDSDVEERAEPAVLTGTPYDLPTDLAGPIDAWLADERRPEPPAKGKAGEIASLPRPGATPALVLLAGAGEGTPADWRKVGAALVRAASGDPELVYAVPTDLDQDGARALVEGALLASYRYTLQSDAKPPKLETLTLVTDDPTRYADAHRRASAVARGTALARDLVNTPSNIKTPEWFAAQAVEALAAVGAECVVRDPDWLAAEGFNGVLAVGLGSVRGPRLLEVRWSPAGAARHVVLVGKGITFDTGGISIKPGPGMQLMKKDMGGGAAVVGAALAAVALELPVRLTVLVPLAENMPSGTAFRPGDVVTHYGGRTSEIFSTDAEGRMVLGDTLAYAAATLEPDYLVDLATLTGGQSVALGKKIAALFSEDDDLVKALSEAAEAAGERVWQLPLPEDYLEHISSDVADANNSGGREAQTATAALFLRPFAGTAREHWAHLDMSGPAWSDSATDELTKGGTGWGARTLTRWLESLT